MTTTIILAPSNVAIRPAEESAVGEIAASAKVTDAFVIVAALFSHCWFGLNYWLDSFAYVHIQDIIMVELFSKLVFFFLIARES